MKNLKLWLFSLLAILAISVFMTSCEQQITAPLEIEEPNDVVLSENVIIYTLPEEFNNMSEGELDAFVENISDEELEALQIPISAKEIEERGCGGWTYQGTRCRNSSACSPKKGEFKAYRKWCWVSSPFGSFPVWHWAYEDRQGCCP